MSISVKDRKLLWGKAGNRCAFPGCSRSLIQLAALGTTVEVVVGQEAHIVAESDTGPRANSSWTQDQRDAYDNLILLCGEHHAVVDKSESIWTVAELHKMKDLHEASVSKEVDWGKQQVDQAWAGLVDQFVKRAGLKEWTEHISTFVRAYQGARFSTLTMLREVSVWINGRIWPPGNEKLCNAMRAFEVVATDLVDVFDRWADAVPSTGDDWFIQTDKFYKRGGYPTPGYHDLAEQYDEHVDLVSDLALELTRCASWVADLIRSDFDPTFMIEEGTLQLLGGPFENGQEAWLAPAYTADELTNGFGPYTTLAAFQDERFTRDLHTKRGHR